MVVLPRRSGRGEGTRGRRYASWLGILAVAAILDACGSAGGDSLFGGGASSSGAGGSDSPDGSAGGSRASGGRAASGGASSTGGAPGTGGRAGTGAAASSGGAPATGGGTGSGGDGTGGALPDAGPCEAPSNPEHSALCLHFVPDRIRARADRQLDKMGTLVVAVFDGPTPEGSAGAQKLAERYIADQGTEVSVDELPVVRFAGEFPDTVYVRAVFIDNPSGLQDGAPGYGLWIGGVDLTSGVVDPQRLLPVPLTAGDALELDMPLRALRKLEATVTLETKPVGDGQGPLLISAVTTPTPTAGTAIHGLAAVACARPDDGPVTATGFVIGSGTFYVGALLNDLGGSGTIPPGSLASLVVNGDSYRVPTRLVVAPAEYAVTSAVPLNYAVPVSDPVIPPNSCADLVP